MVEVLLVHPGGPFWQNKDDGVWTIPKGEVAENEDFLAAAIREFKEELGVNVAGPFFALGSVMQKAGKVVHAWALEGDLDATKIVSNTFEMEWPPKSGKLMLFAEVDRAGFFSLSVAKLKMNAAQIKLLESLESVVLSK